MRFNCSILFALAFAFLGFLFIPLTVQASLYEVTDENSPFYLEDLEDAEVVSDFVLPSYAVDEDGDIYVNADVTLDDIVSSDVPPDSDTESLLDESVSLITYEDVEMIVSEALAASNTVDLSIADAYLSATIVDVFERSVLGYPSYYKYAAYRLNSSDTSEGYLLIGSDARISGDYLEFYSGSHLLHYYRQRIGTSGSYDYKYDMMTLTSTYRIPFGSGQLLYTNMVSGYPLLSASSSVHYNGFLFCAFFVLIIVVVIFRRKN